MEDCMITSDTPNASFAFVWVQTGYAPRYHPSTLHKPSSRFQLRKDAMFKRRGEMGTQVVQNPLLARTTDTFKLQYPSEPRKDTIRWDKTDTEMRELLIWLIAQNKEQQLEVQIKAMNLMLKEVLAQQTLLVNYQQVTSYRNRAALAE